MVGVLKQITQKELIENLRVKNSELAFQLNKITADNKILKICNSEIMEAFKGTADENKRLKKELEDALAYIGRQTLKAA